MSIFTRDATEEMNRGRDALERFKQHGDIELTLREVRSAIAARIMNHDGFMQQIRKLLLAKNTDRAIKLFNVLGNREDRLWFYLGLKMPFAILWWGKWGLAFTALVLILLRVFNVI